MGLDVMLECAGLGEVIVHACTLDEAISSPTRARVRFVTEQELDVDGAIGTTATVTIVQDEDTRQLELLVTGVHSFGKRSRFFYHEVELEHALVRLELSGGSRYFGEMKPGAVIKKILGEHEIAFDWKAEEGLITNSIHQYRETDFAFVHRLLEDEGISYVVAQDKIRFVDSEQGFEDITGEVTVPLVAGDVRGDSVVDFRVTHQAGTDAIRLLDYNENTPHLELVAEATTVPSPRTLVTEYPGGFQEFRVGGARAAVRVEELASRRIVATGVSACLRFEAGRYFTLSESSRDTLDVPWLLRSIRHELTLRGVEGVEKTATYAASFVASPKAQPFRPQRTTPRPRASGHDVVEIIGPQGSEIHPDEKGRVQAWFHWEDADIRKKNPRWIRVLQPALGGSMFVPRVGWKMAVLHVAGLPERPIVVARLDHGIHPPAYDLPANKTRSTFRTVSSPKAEKFTEIRFEDAAGKMELFVHAAKDWEEKVLNDKVETVGKNESVEIGAASWLRVDKTQTITIGKARTSTVGGTELLRVVGDREAKVHASEKVVLEQNERTKIAGDDEETVGATYKLVAKHEITRTSKGAYTLKVGAAATSESGSGFTIGVAGKVTHTVGGARMIKVGETNTETTQGDVSTTIGGVSVQNAMGKRVVTSEGKATFTIGGVAALVAVTKAQISAKKIKITVGGAVALSGGGGIVNLTPASAAVVGMVTIKASGDVIVTGTPNLVG